METNLIRPENEKFRTFYASHIAFCDGNFCAAGLLDVFNRFHIYKLEQQKSNRKYNDIAEMHGDGRTQYEHLYQAHTQDELVEHVMKIFSVNVVAKAINFLVEKKVITTHKNPNPKYQFDKTTHYLFHPHIFNTWLKANWPDEEPDCYKPENDLKPVDNSRTTELSSRCHRSEVSGNETAGYTREKTVETNIVDNSRTAELSSRCHRSEVSIPQNPCHRSHRSEAAIYNIDFNKENNLNLTSTDIKNEVQEQTTGSVEVIFENKKCIEHTTNQNLSRSQTNPHEKPNLNTAVTESNLVLRVGSIGERLTPGQEIELQQRFLLLEEKCHGKISSPATLLQEIKFCLLDKTALTGCENDFHRKWCCIENMVLKNQWRRPFKLSRQVDETHEATITKNNAAIEKELSAIDKTLSSLSHEIQSDNELLTSLSNSVCDDDLKDVIIKQNKRREEKIQHLLATRLQLQQKNVKPALPILSHDKERFMPFPKNTTNNMRNIE